MTDTLSLSPEAVNERESNLIEEIQAVLTPDLLKWGTHKAKQHPFKGHCYVAAEALYHALGGLQAGYTPMFIKHEGASHWYVRTPDHRYLDPTAEQFSTPVPYAEGTAKGFMTGEPSKRARTVAARLAGDQSAWPAATLEAPTEEPTPHWDSTSIRDAVDPHVLGDVGKALLDAAAKVPVEVEDCKTQPPKKKEKTVANTKARPDSMATLALNLLKEHAGQAVDLTLIAKALDLDDPSSPKARGRASVVVASRARIPSGNSDWRFVHKGDEQGTWVFDKSYKRGPQYYGNEARGSVQVAKQPAPQALPQDEVLVLGDWYEIGRDGAAIVLRGPDGGLYTVQRLS